MKELTNLSVYTEDIARFDNNWNVVSDYAQNQNLNGIELLMGYDPPPDIPPELVQAVHLPFWITWLDVWRNVPNAIARYYPGLDPQWLKFYCGGKNSGEIIETNRQLWQNAAQLNPAYAVFHVSHVEVEHAFTRNYPYTNLDVVDAVADLLNTVAATFTNGEPPVRLALENLWWPGLTFTSNAVTEHFAERLNFDNWAFVLDTGHLMNTNHTLDTEEQAIDFVLQTVENLSEGIKNRIEAIHFHLSISGGYQREQRQRGLPANFHTWNLMEQVKQSQLNAIRIDQHRPFTNPRCREIINALQPNFVTHEFLTANLAELTTKLHTQQTALNFNGSNVKQGSSTSPAI